MPEYSENFAPFGACKTWYRVTGELGGDKRPLIVLHGGPGCTHDYLLTLAELSETGRAVVHYDQLGNGNSTHLPDRGVDFWTPELFIAELNNLLAHLGVAESGYDIYGQSWGGMLGAQFATTRPVGLKNLIIANSPASMEIWVAEANRLRADLPPAVQATLLRHEADGTTDDPAYVAAVDVFYARHVCRVQPMPDAVARSFAAITADPTVYHNMNGPSEFHVIGSLKSWTIIDALQLITARTLLISGRHDEATLACVSPYLFGIADVSWHVFGHSSHLPHVEEKEACLAVVAAWLDRH